MTVAIMFVGVVAVNHSTAAAATSSCSITTTLKVGSKGAQVMCLQTLVGVTADGSFGPATKAAVEKWQASQGLTADGVFGKASRAAFNGGSVAVAPVTPVAPACPAGQFNPTTGQPCGTTTPTTFPVGCTSNLATAFSSTTGQNCATGAASTTTVANSTAAGNISSDGIIGGYNNTIVGEGDTNHQVAGFQLTGAGGGSNLNLSYATLELTNIASGSGRLIDYVSSVAVFENGTQIGTVPASAFSSTNNASGANDIYSASFPLTGATVTAGQTSNFYIAITANSSVDSNNFGAEWEVALNNIRFTDGTGLTLTYSPSSTGIGGLNPSVEFTFGSAATANNIVLNVSRASSDQNAHTVTVNATGNTTQKVPLLAFTLSDQGGQTVSVNKLPVYLETTPNVQSGVGSVSYVSPEVYLMNGTTVLDSENVSGASTDGTGPVNMVNGVNEGGNGVAVGTYFYPVYFKNFSTPLLVNGSPVTLTVAADINAIGTGNSNYPAGTSLSASTTLGGTNGWDLSVGTQNGTEINPITSTIIPGIAQGQTVAFFATGASVSETSDVCLPSNSGGASDTSSMSCAIAFSVTANGTSVYVPENSVVSNTPSTAGTTYSVVNGSGQEVAPSGSLLVSASTSQVGTNATADSSNEWVIAPGTTANFSATVTLTDKGSVNGGIYRAFLTAVNYNSAFAPGSWTTSFGYNLGSVNTVVPQTVQVY